MDKNQKQILNNYAKRYISEVMADQLTARGYVSRNNEGIHWYRVINGDLLQAVYFYSQWAKLPLLLGVGYGCHPLFVAPEYPNSIHIGTMRRSVEALNPGRMLFKQINRATYADDIAVTCPDDEFCGADILSDILQSMDGIHNIEASYVIHKQAHINVMHHLGLPDRNAFRHISTDFMDEAVYFDDRELYPACIMRITNELDRYERAQKVRKLHYTEMADVEALVRLKAAIIDGNREPHIHYLQMQQQKNIS